MWGFFAHQSVQDTLPIKQNNKKSTTTEIISSVSLQQLGKIQFMSGGEKKKKGNKKLPSLGSVHLAICISRVSVSVCKHFEMFLSIAQPDFYSVALIRKPYFWMLIFIASFTCMHKTEQPKPNENMYEIPL